MLGSAIVLISAALACYTLGVWAERREGTLRGRHVAAFVTGLAFDAIGTGVMGAIARAGGAVTTGPAGALNAVMSATGALALAVMALHTAWAIVVLVRDRAAERRSFHRLSVGVWALWLVPYMTGMAGSMAG